MTQRQNSLSVIKYYDHVKTPIGVLLLAGCEKYLRAVGFTQGQHFTRGEHLTQDEHLAAPEAQWQRDESRFNNTKEQLGEYFAGERKSFDLPIMPLGTEFQMAAWQALRKIPYGQTRTYGEQAAMIGRPKAVRAVGGANNKNPLPIIIPCHRVIGANGKLVGYGGGLEIKKFLLELEGVL